MDSFTIKNLQDKPIVPSSIRNEIQLKNKIGYLGLLAQLCTNYCKEFDSVFKENYSLENEYYQNQLEIKKEAKLSKKRKIELERNVSIKPKIFDLLRVEEETSPKSIYYEKHVKKFKSNQPLNISISTENSKSKINALLYCNWISDNYQCSFSTHSKQELETHLVTHRNCQLLNDYNLYAKTKNYLSNNIII